MMVNEEIFFSKRGLSDMYGDPLRTKLYRWQKHVENIIRKSKLVKYTECNKKYESRFAKYICSETKKKNTKQMS